MEDNTVDYRNLIQYNLEMMMDDVARSNDPKKEWRVQSYQKALENLPATPIYTNGDLGGREDRGREHFEQDQLDFNQQNESSGGLMKGFKWTLKKNNVCKN